MEAKTELVAMAETVFTGKVKMKDHTMEWINWLYTVQSEERILKRCPDVRDCTVLAARAGDGTVSLNVMLQLAPEADPAIDRADAVRAALGELVAAVPPLTVTITDDELVVGATGKVRKFLMRERLLAGADNR